MPCSRRISAAWSSTMKQALGKNAVKYLLTRTGLFGFLATPSHRVRPGSPEGFARTDRLPRGEAIGGRPWGQSFGIAVERPRSYDLVDKTKTIGPGEAGANRL